MADDLTTAMWADLRRCRPCDDEELATTPIHDGIVAGMDRHGDLHLLVTVQQGPTVPLPPDLNGLRVRHQRLIDHQAADLIAPASHEQLFSALCRCIVEAVVSQHREPWAAIAAIIRDWSSAWKPSKGNMDQTTQVGLYGELWTLREILIPAIGSKAAWMWSGPDAERHDFVGREVHVEVKTTRRSTPEHEISRLDQLRKPAGKRLLLVSVQVEQSRAGRETLADMIDSVLELLRDDLAASNEVMAGLFKVGWTDDMRRTGELIRLNLRDALVFEVREGFPRLPDDFAKPTGVVSIKYVIDLANVPDLSVDHVSALISAGM